MSGEKKIIVWVGALLQNKEGKFLFLKRHKDEAWGGMWQLPGGKMEWGELPIDTLNRELKEEISVTKLQGEPELLGTHTSFIKIHGIDYHALQLIYKANLDSDNIRISEEHDDFIWMSIDDAKETPLAAEINLFLKR